jgi:hypothetical protein
MQLDVIDVEQQTKAKPPALIIETQRTDPKPIALKWCVRKTFVNKPVIEQLTSNLCINTSSIYSITDDRRVWIKGDY